MRTGYNQLRIEIYSSGSTPIVDPGNELPLAENIHFTTAYPGGIYIDASFFVPRDVTRALPFKHAQRVVIHNGPTLVWEGWIADVIYDFTQREGIGVQCLGYIAILNTRYKYNRIIDRRFQSNIFGAWYVEDAQANDKCTFDFTDRLRLEPKPEAWALNERAYFRWASDGGSAAKRVKFDYELQEGAQAWELELYDVTNAVSLWSVTASGTGSQDITLSTAAGRIEFRLYSRAAQTPTGSTIFGEIRNLRVLCENASGVITTTVADILKAYVVYAGGTFSTSTALIAANTYDLETAGLVADDLRESIYQLMERVAKFSSDDSAWSVGIRESERVAGETKPVIYYEQQPVLSDYDYAFRIDSPSLLGGGRLVASAFPDALKTFIMVTFRNERGKERWNYARDTAAGDKYIERTQVVSAKGGVTDYTSAGVYASAILNQTKKLQYFMDGPLTITGYIENRAGTRVPVSQIQAGKRLKLLSFIADFGDETAGSGFTFLVQRTEYNDENESVSLTLGKPADLSAVIADTAAGI